MDDIQLRLALIEHKHKLLQEGRGHIDHPEDSVFSGSENAERAVSSMQDTVGDPDKITVKYDGYPSLVFGRSGPQSPFMIVDKHMFNKSTDIGRKIYCVEDFIQYDRNRGADRSSLYTYLKNIWQPLEQAYGRSSELYWGDLLFGAPQQVSNGQITFRPNPNGIIYKVDADSDLGKTLLSKSSAIVVHSSMPRAATSTDQAESLNGTTGTLNPNTSCGIISSRMPTTPEFDIGDSVFNSASGMIEKYSDAIDSATMSRSISSLLKTYINYKVRTGNLSNLVGDFYSYAESKSVNISGIDRNSIVAVFTVWSSLYNIKMAIWSALQSAVVNSPIKGYLANGQIEQEGFVANGFKYVNRLGFSRQNLNGNK